MHEQASEQTELREIARAALKAMMGQEPPAETVERMALEMEKIGDDLPSGHDPNIDELGL